MIRALELGTIVFMYGSKSRLTPSAFGFGWALHCAFLTAVVPVVMMARRAEFGWTPAVIAVAAAVRMVCGICNNVSCDHLTPLAAGINALRACNGQASKQHRACRRYQRIVPSCTIRHPIVSFIHCDGDFSHGIQGLRGLRLCGGVADPARGGKRVHHCLSSHSEVQQSTSPAISSFKHLSGADCVLEVICSVQSSLSTVVSGDRPGFLVEPLNLSRLQTVAAILSPTIFSICSSLRTKTYLKFHGLVGFHPGHPCVSVLLLSDYQHKQIVTTSTPQVAAIH